MLKSKESPTPTGLEARGWRDQTCHYHMSRHCLGSRGTRPSPLPGLEGLEFYLFSEARVTPPPQQDESLPWYSPTPPSANAVHTAHGFQFSVFMTVSPVGQKAPLR